MVTREILVAEIGLYKRLSDRVRLAKNSWMTKNALLKELSDAMMDLDVGLGAVGAQDLSRVKPAPSEVVVEGYMRAEALRCCELGLFGTEDMVFVTSNSPFPESVAVTNRISRREVKP